MKKLEYDIQKMTIKKIYDWFDKKELIIDKSYQRRCIWLPRDKVRLIETILLGLIIPEIYLWDAETNPDNGITITHIVDGQQRINAIVDFICNNLKLSKEFFIDDVAKQNYGDKLFKDLPDEIRTEIWNYCLPIVQIKNIEISDIKTMFYRLNLTNYSLNDQEKRHSNSWGKFVELSKEISEHTIWEDYKLFNFGDIKRMKDEEFCSTLVLLAIKGIINQTNQEPLNNAYTDYAEDYPDYETDKYRIFKWIDTIKLFINSSNLSFVRKRTQLYTVFCLMDYIVRNNIEININLITRFNTFVDVYDKFENNSEATSSTSVEEEAIKRYKLASSEGVNKIRNRKVRYEILKNYVLGTLKEQNLDL
jgi:hypothetical protein